ncbi:NAD-dependent epimerase/dehydratase family protein [Verticiella alkaliphila]|uniref:NAD-dependent epimerase/dehydratase family protein n=1 Tax=Verticiella alkaliphila TaxID=2779529 RepID=UPI0035303FA8
MIALVTGGAGFIGTHTLVQLYQAGVPYVVIDNLCNSCPQALAAVSRITGEVVPFIRGDIKNSELMLPLLKSLQAHDKVVTVLHFAALKSVAESVSDPMRYYDNNIAGTISLLQSMTAAGVHQLIFSSSATVYGEPRRLPFDESHTIAPTSPYGHTKAIAEQMLAHWAASDPRNKVLSLRYFNPVGRTPVGSSARIRTACPTISFPASRAWRADG